MKRKPLISPSGGPSLAELVGRLALVGHGSAFTSRRQMRGAVTFLTRALSPLSIHEFNRLCEAFATATAKELEELLQ